MGLLALGAVKGTDKIKQLLGATQEVTVQYEIGQIINILELDSLTGESFPDPQTFSEFLRNNMRSKAQTRDTSKDQWGNPYRLELNGATATVRSAGPDKQFGSADDIWGVAKNP